MTMEISNVCEIITAIAALLGVIGGLVSAYCMYRQRQEDKDVKRSEFLGVLVERFGSLDARELFVAADAEDAGAEWFSNAVTDTEKRIKTDSALSFFAMLCYMAEKKVISEEEFSFFSDQLTVLLDNDNVKRYLLDDEGCVRSSFDHLVRYAVRHNLRDYPRLENFVQHEKDVDPNEGRSAADQDDKIVIIKISRLYRDGMGENDVYEVSRAHWKARYEQIKQFKLVVAVAQGIIRGAYDVENWYDSGESDGKITAAEGRVMFSGWYTHDPQLAGWIGKSIKIMFTKGAANPIRYSSRAAILSAIEHSDNS